MNSDLYALIALAARYWFAALIVVLLFRGWRMTVADNRRAKLLREWMGQTGCVGELIANPGAKKRVSYPIPREGILGSAGAADVRIRHRDLKRAHAHFELREGGILIRPLGRAALSVGGGFTGDAVFLQDGDVLTIGKLQLMLVLFDAPVEEEADEWFEVAPGEAARDDSDEWEDEPPAAARARYASEEDRYAARPAKRRAGKAPVTLEGQFTEKPAAHAPEEDRYAARPAKRHAGKAPVTLEGQFTEKPAAPGRRVPASVNEPFTEKPAAPGGQPGEKPRRGRRVAVQADLPFDPSPPAARDDWFDESPAPGRAPSRAPRGKGTRAKKAAGGNTLDEDAIWPDL